MSRSTIGALALSVAAFLASCSGKGSSGDCAAPVIGSFTASPPSISQGGSSTLSWSTSGATSVTIDHGVEPGTETSATVSPADTTEYTLTATNACGASEKRVTVTVTAACPDDGACQRPVITSFMASPASVAPGAIATLSWDVSGATTIEIDQGIGPVTGASTSVAPSSTTTYTLTATNAAGSVEASATVTVLPRDSWRARAPMPTPRTSAAAAAVGWKIYVIGGQAAGGCVATVEEYDTRLDTWTRKADMPTARCGLAAVELGGKIWAVGGGSTPSYFADRAVMETYDPATDTWAATAPGMLTPRTYIAAAVASGRIYTLGGTNTDQTPGGWWTVEQFDPASNQWSAAPSLVASRSMFAATSMSGTIYAIGGWGRLEPTSGLTPLSEVESYWPPSSMNKWWAETPMAHARIFPGAATVGSRIYALGGRAFLDPDVGTSVEEYDPTSRTWTERAPMPTGRSGLAAVAVNGVVYAIGGDGDTAGTVRDTVEAFTP